MAHYAWLDADNTVINIVYGKDETEQLNGEDVDWENLYLNAALLIDSNVVSVKRTSYNTIYNEYWDTDLEGNRTLSADQSKAFRGNMATIGGKYLTDNNVFVGIQPYPSWILTENWKWTFPVPMPDDYEVVPYEWNEDTVSWIQVDLESDTSSSNT